MTSPGISDRDRDRIVAYVDGSLSTAERDAFELELSTDPQLESELESFLTLDTIQREAAARGSARGRGRVHAFRRPVAWVAAAVVVVALGVWLGGRGTAGVECRVAVLRSGATLASYNRALELDPALRPHGRALRGGDPGHGVPAEEYRALVHARETARRVEALGRANAVAAAYFVVPVEAEEAFTALVVGLPDGGAPRLLFPAPDDRVPRRFEPGVVHVLPAEPVTISPESAEFDDVEFSAGFLLPADTDRMRVLVALRAELLDTVALDRFAGTLEDADVDVHAELEGMGFVVRELVVDAPR